MKKLLLSSFLAVTTVCGFAQLDLAITQIVSPSASATITDAQQVTSEFVVTNDGTTTLNPNDTIYFRNELNGTTQTYTSGGSQFNVFSYILTKTLAPNDTVLVGITLPIAWSVNNVIPGATFTWGFNVRGSTCCPTLDDDDVSNNVLSVNLTAAGTVGLEEDVNITTTEVYFSEGSLYVNGENLNGTSKVELYNLLGQKVFESTISETTFNEVYDLSFLTNGIYISNISDSKGTVIKSTKIMR
ncbi:T9SS type A sorting domain-containing protein [Owenweeksia hongkongensis]|uniref:T9SS type A sorting domain-containing protein n=1 Tax=Owenweeksia hongkongensis TaxID=253245 RepID=UPI003A946C0A